MPKSKFVRILVEGPTADGRTIDRKWIEEMAASYDPATYTARINCEHIPGLSPDRPFNCYGSVTAVKAEEVELQIDGKPEKRMALFGELDANEQLVEINRKGQKLYSSAEVQPNFAGTSKAYLVGLAVTDRPASLGTEPLKFAALKSANIFTPADEVAIELVDAPADPGGLTAAIRDGFAAVAAKFARAEEKPKVEPKPDPATAGAPDFAAFATQMGEALSASVAQIAQASTAAVNELRTEFAALKTKIEQTEGNGVRRHAATGAAAGSGVATDC